MKNLSPLVSVVMPAYNHERYVVEAMQSVRDQTFERWELIVIDDGSRDATWREIQRAVSEWNDSRITIFTQANAGSHATLNRGLGLAVAPYLAILNSDDRYAPDRLARLVAAAETQAGCGFWVTGVCLIDGQGQPMDAAHGWNVMYRDLCQHWIDAQEEKHPAVNALLWGNFTVSTSNFFFARGVLSAVGGFGHFRYVPDWDFALRVAIHPEVTLHFLVDDLLLDYRLHGNNTILHGALRNHAEAYHVLRGFQRRWARRGHALPAHAVDRLHYLARFIRHEHARGLLERHQGHWQVSAAAREAQLVELQSALAQAQAEAEAMATSRSWRLTAPLRRVTALASTVVRGAHAIRRRLTAAWRRRAAVAVGANGYAAWLKAEQAYLTRLRAQAPATLQALASRPLVSIVMPVHDTEPAHLEAAVTSVLAQWYPDWELCICDDASQRQDTRNLLASLAARDPRIRVQHRATSGHIAQATNDALGMAAGELAVFLDHDDLLAPQALLRLVEASLVNPGADLIYSDEDKIDVQGRRSLPFFKPNQSPALLWSQNYVGHVMCVRMYRLRALGGLREGLHGSQDHDLVLRLIQAGGKLVHLPEVLYHWRIHPNSTAANANAKPYAHNAGKRAVSDHLHQRYGSQCLRVDDGDYAFVYDPRFAVPADTLVSIVIPTRDKVELLKPCIDSIHRLTCGVRYEIIVLDNGSTEPATLDYWSALRNDERVRVVPADMPFNWSRLNNVGRRHARGQVLVFLNNDTLVITPDWLQRLAEYALLPDTGTVGALLLYPDQTIQHAGVVVGMGGWADHVFKGHSLQHFPSPFVSSMVPRNVLACTGACVAVATARFDHLGGFDEAFEICGSDVELGIRAHQRGLYNVYLPAVRLYHLESKTRSAHVPAGDFEQSALKYGTFRTEGDPYFNPNLRTDMTSPTPRADHA